ncbi:hypothetical protein [cf. Phormidesmis sp. LEGE 11477]|uniref:hypothetical protein n=1 Tax=cf. Phormidesmis sp. LEGE 11477 TaxID=1828680 RepID=UPI001881CC42|nr:hypothetical protein [cf. Phormidesmis sp. LEGE 11477]MBE9064706.1 hypothetical protein [cf. Phormidesmis sp. LEGE 11477]
MEGVIAHVRGGTVLNIYDFVDVIEQERGYGWQVKSTKSSTPVTWKRAKIPNSQQLILASREGTKGLENLGNAIIHFCNQHIRESFALYRLEQLGYSRLIVYPDRAIVYFEKQLCSKEQPDLFDPNNFSWRWASPKVTTKKEQLPALHGIHKLTNQKWWAWHGLGENQLHFSGEKNWWPSHNDPHAIRFNLPSAAEKLSIEEFLEILDRDDFSS